MSSRLFVPGRRADPRFEGHAEPPTQSESAREASRALREWKRIRLDEHDPQAKTKPLPAEVPRRSADPSRPGIHLDARSGKWRAWVRQGRRQLWLGSFATDVEASEARLAWIAANVLAAPPEPKRAYLGVCLDKRYDRYRAYYMADGKRVDIPGSFATREEAAVARELALSKKDSGLRTEDSNPEVFSCSPQSRVLSPSDFGKDGTA